MENVRIQLVGKQAEGEIVEVDIEASYEKKGDFHSVSYNEIPKDACIATETTLIFNESHLTILKKGEVNSKMEFKKGEKLGNDYVTAYATFFMETDTKELRFMETEKSLDFFVSYDLYINGGMVSESEVRFSVSF